MEHLPVFLDIKGRDVLVVGGGEVAERKARLLLRAGARVSVVAPAADEGLTALADGDGVTVVGRPFRESDVAGRALVVAATGNRDVDRAVSAAARARAVPVNVVDRPDLSSFIMPAIVDRDPVTVAISSAGTAPVLARMVRARIEALLPSRLGRLARFAERFRDAVRTTVPDATGRRRFWERILSGPVAAAVLEGDERWARERMLAEVNRPPERGAPDGIVFIVGAGPGDPDLLTLKALRLLQEADVIVHDRLVAPAVLDYGRRDARRIGVGKEKGNHSVSQSAINRTLLAEARAGRRVVRLKGGDPFVFGRGGEEREFLLRHGVPVEVVPGITAATGCAAAAGIPLTHRDHAHAVAFVTGHGKDGEPTLDWAALARGGQTLAVYMGASTAGEIAARLLQHGLSATTPVAVIENGTRPDQRVTTGHLADLAGLAARGGQGPKLIVVGDVVRHADAWIAADLPQAAAS